MNTTTVSFHRPLSRKGREDPPEMVVDLHGEPGIDGPHLADRGLVLVTRQPREAGREVPRVQARR